MEHATFRSENIQHGGDAHRTVVFPVSLTLAIAVAHGNGQRPGMGAIREHRAESNHTIHIEFFSDGETLAAVFLPAVVRLRRDLGKYSMPLIKHNLVERSLRPNKISTTGYMAQHGTRHLIVIEGVAVYMANLTGFVMLDQITDDVRSRLASIIPSLESGDHHRTWGIRIFTHTSRVTWT